MRSPIFVVDSSMRGTAGPSREQRRELARRTRRAARGLGIHPEAAGDIVVRICDAEAIADLKEQFFGWREHTDVLSFPGPGTDGRGDIALCWPVCCEQARRHRVPALHEASILVVHALAHLLGHDHRRREMGRRMHKAERRVLRKLRVPDLPRSYGLRPVREAP